MGHSSPIYLKANNPLDMEPEMGAWSTLEYIAISTESAASGSSFYLTSVPPSLADDLPPSLRQYINAPLKVTSVEVTRLPEIAGERVCLLDPQAKKQLSPEDAESFDTFVFGGILGR
jgi:ribosome biogenesis SPOUT family RNA methylase Rps3